MKTTVYSDDEETRRKAIEPIITAYGWQLINECSIINLCSALEVLYEKGVLEGRKQCFDIIYPKSKKARVKNCCSGYPNCIHNKDREDCQ